jgi:hypothetical protein
VRLEVLTALLDEDARLLGRARRVGCYLPTFRSGEVPSSSGPTIPRFLIHSVPTLLWEGVASTDFYSL